MFRFSFYFYSTYPFSCIQINKLGKFNCSFKICAILTRTSLIIKFKTNIIQTTFFCFLNQIIP